MTVEFLRPLKPRYVIWCYYESNDLGEFRKEASTGLARYLYDETTARIFGSAKPR